MTTVLAGSGNGGGTGTPGMEDFGRMSDPFNEGWSFDAEWTRLSFRTPLLPELLDPSTSSKLRRPPSFVGPGPVVV